MTYVAPMRSAVLHAARHGLPFGIDALMALGVAHRLGARAYATRLVNDGVLVEPARDRFTCGPAWDAWIHRGARTRPGGHRRRSIVTPRLRL